MLNFLLKHGEREAVGDLGSALCEAVRGEHADILKILLHHGDRGDFGGMGSALHEAVLSGRGDFVSILLENNASVDARDSIGDTPLHAAAQQGETEILRSLLGKGAFADSLGFEDRTPLYVAAERGHKDVVRALLAAGADKSVRCGRSAKVALLVAAEYGRVDALEALIEHGVDVRAASRSQNTALHYAARKDHGGAIDTLVEAGAAVHAQNREGCTPLHEGARISSYEVVLALLNHGADVNAQDHQGRTPLYHGACKAGKVGSARVVDLLLKSGADETIVATDRRSPAHVVSLSVRMRCELPEEYDIVRTLLANAPADRSWRRRGFLALCRAHGSRLDPGQEGSATHAGGAPSADSRGNSARTEARTGGGAGREGARDELSRPNWPGVVLKVLELAEEGIFRTIVGYL